MKEGRNKGFSMIELIIVMAIIGIIVALIGPQLISYYEKSRATRDLDTLEAIYDAYEGRVAEVEDPAKLKLDDTEILQEMAVPNSGAYGDLFKSKQLKGAKVECFYDQSTSTYGVYAYGQNGYTGMMRDNKGTENEIGQSGGDNFYYDKNKHTLVQFPVPGQ